MIALPAVGELEAIAVAVGREAAAAVRSSADDVTTLDTKSSPTDVVTAADLAVETLIRDRLHAATPGATIIGEEHGDTVGDTELGWVVDPIDGTVNYLHGLPFVSVSIAAAVDGRVVAGVVVDVHRNEVFSAAAGCGSRKDGRPVAVSCPPALDRALVATGYAYDANVRAAQGQVLAGLIGRVADVRGFGSTALHLAWVACGRLDGFYQSHANRWDYAAGALIAEEAGAVVRLPDGPAGMLVAAAPSVAEDLAAAVS
ncbi:inositol monophosphatase family protein [Euzebya pacifica]|uniref:inositol monophosphatase family protein n=1 Tax=Euzebya pacifica TaxID=1608957 RepID=UPI0030F8B918